MSPKIISKKTDYEQGWIKVISAKLELDNGKKIEWNYLDNGDSVSVVAVDDVGNVYLVKEWRVAWNKEIMQIPAGGVRQGSSEEEMVQQAHNEIREELGMDARKIEKLISVLDFARSHTRFNIFLATGLFESKKNPDENEFVKITKMPLDDALKFFLKKSDTPFYTILGLMLAKEKLGKK